MTRLRASGVSFKAGPGGRLPRIGRPPAQDVAQTLAPLIAECLAQGATSVLLRGSLARGATLTEAADIDLIVVTHHGEPTLTHAMPLDILALPLADLTGSPYFSFLTAHSAVTLAGPKIEDQLPDPRLGPAALAHLPQSARWLAANDRDFPGTDGEDAKELTQWICKRIIRSLAEATFPSQRVYSRDIAPCAALATAHFPEQVSLITRLAEQAVFGDAPSAEVAHHVHAARPLLEQGQQDLAAAGWLD